MVVTISADSDDPHSVIASAVCEDLKTLTDVEGQLDRMWDTYDSLTELPVEESEPYKYYYKARELLEIARESLKRKLAANETSDTENLEWHLANIDLAMGRNLFWCEEVSKAEVRFLRALKLGLLSSNRLEKKYVFFILDCLQQLSNIWLGRADYTKAINFLARAALLHKAVEDRVEWEDADMENLDRTKTLTAYGLARAYGGLGMISSASRACSMTLARQLEHNMAGSDDPGRKKDAPFDYREWSRNAISLADYYIGRGEFWTAEYLMHAGRIIAVGEERWGLLEFKTL
ncbi:hypothetical protein FOL47_004102 [Perkinsus chesapeaki]|uniref:Uncharacterized protein n=1 Tax=Perkinsus chesapeaki TaxID=330153 RepID=A0A7J6M4K6_PERCH|nr:hypothetical protein FOL47_004102 [Perkinsus chesapeaki]